MPRASHHRPSGEREAACPAEARSAEREVTADFRPLYIQILLPSQKGADGSPSLFFSLVSRGVIALRCICRALTGSCPPNTAVTFVVNGTNLLPVSGSVIGLSATIPSLGYTCSGSSATVLQSSLLGAPYDSLQCGGLQGTATHTVSVSANLEVSVPAFPGADVLPLGDSHRVFLRHPLSPPTSRFPRHPLPLGHSHPLALSVFVSLCVCVCSCVPLFLCVFVFFVVFLCLRVSLSLCVCVCVCVAIPIPRRPLASSPPSSCVFPTTPILFTSSSSGASPRPRAWSRHIGVQRSLPVRSPSLAVVLRRHRFLRLLVGRLLPSSVAAPSTSSSTRLYTSAAAHR
jgi:hypothetical protein